MSQETPWPDGCSGALSLTFDDGHPSQLKRAVPILNDLDLKSTFFIRPGMAKGRRHERLI
jgi:peptidoglycan/xylan/chitin deacetylase (PgdA/CDA1 family)